MPTRVSSQPVREVAVSVQLMPAPAPPPSRLLPLPARPPAPSKPPAPAVPPVVPAGPALPLPPPVMAPPPRLPRLDRPARKILPVHATPITRAAIAPLRPARADSKAASPRPAAMIPAQTAAQAANTWQAQLAAWLQAHKHYPEAAREMDEEGDVDIRFTVARDGRVTEVSVVQGSGVPALNNAALAMLQDATVPPLPPAMAQSAITITVELRYALDE